MRPFAFTRADSAPAAIQFQIAATEAASGTPSVHAPEQYLAGGRTLLDLMKLDVVRPTVVTAALMLTKAEQYRAKAQEAEANAERMRDLAAKEASLEIARLWREIAAKAENNKR